MKKEIKEWTEKRKEQIKMVGVAVGTASAVGIIMMLKHALYVSNTELGLRNCIEQGYMKLIDPDTGESLNSDDWSKLIKSKVEKN